MYLTPAVVPLFLSDVSGFAHVQLGFCVFLTTSRAKSQKTNTNECVFQSEYSVKKTTALKLFTLPKATHGQRTLTRL